MGISHRRSSESIYPKLMDDTGPSQYPRCWTGRCRLSICKPSIPLLNARQIQTLIGFRSERSTADAIEQCHIVLSNRGGAEWILEGDIGSCFDTIAHEWLEAHIPMDKPILHKWLKAGFIEEDILKPTGSGTPQGGPASPVLANLTLDGFREEAQ